MSRGNTAPTKTIMTFDHIPIPNQRMKRGRKMSLGVALKTVTKGSIIASRRRDLPMIKLNGKPTIIASPSPKQELNRARVKMFLDFVLDDQLVARLYYPQRRCKEEGHALR